MSTSPSTRSDGAPMTAPPPEALSQCADRSEKPAKPSSGMVQACIGSDFKLIKAKPATELKKPKAAIRKIVPKHSATAPASTAHGGNRKTDGTLPLFLYFYRK